MITWIAAIFLVVGFVAVVRMFGLPEISKTVVVTARRSLEVIRSASMNDDAKAAELQGHARQLFMLFIKIAFGCGLAVFLPIGLVWLCSLAQIVSLESVFRVAFSPGFIIVSGALAVIALVPVARPSRESDRYSRLDKLLHHVAFQTYASHIPLADLEERMFADKLAACTSDRPVFITALPRAGTTLMLECCAHLPDFASHCYRDMPFVLTPCLWSRFSAAFSKEAGESRQRAHGDGMLINIDSPEALEEVIWKTFWRQHYRNDRIIPWKNEENEKFREFFSSHMRKIILLRRGMDASAARYISKNNGNIARIPMLSQIFPASVIIVPFREPFHHATSLLEQHRNFLRIHEQDPFASAYMLAIGHFDFGQNLRPIDFDNWFDVRASRDAKKLDFWIEYWIASYGYLLAKNTGNVHFFNYERFCEIPVEGLRRLGEAIGTRHPETLLSAATTIRAVRSRNVDTAAVPSELLQKANDLYGRLKQVALN